MRIPHLWLAALLLAPEIAVAADERADSELVQSARRVAAEMAREKYGTVLVVVRAGGGSENEPQLDQTLAALRREFLKTLQDEKLTVRTSADVDAVVERKPARIALRPADVVEFCRLADFDAMLSVEYRKRGGQRTLRMELLDHQESLWTGTIRPPNLTLESRIPAKTSAPPATSATAPAQANVGETPAAKTGEKQEAQLPTVDEIVKQNRVTGFNLKVLRYAISQFGKQVGNGECWTLADEALRAAGAKRADGYTFGAKIPLANIQPGDILQMYSVRIESGGFVYSLGVPQHTAIVHSVSGNTVRILHQNFGKRQVTAFEFDVRDVKQGTIEAYRPIAGE